MFEKLNEWAARLRAAFDPPDEETGYWNDPLSHPALQGMSLRELADLPFPRHAAETAPMPERRVLQRPEAGRLRLEISARTTIPDAVPCR